MAKSYYKQIIVLFKAHGVYFKREGKGSHEVWFSPLTNRPISVPQNCKGKGTANNILKDAGIKHKL